ncbi:hypothetical protein THIOM_004928 [Candidatus Thiomargarita nelsonii]|uniref:Uncharacterized protein n=1 Tax=Candidatus Thiomargarita nelsonii TaxID=1003181 RepID=A0A176RUK4_9GAMM|nr:hypothetical protein THIOM_004928 [Candidatus Thiomargarita nelsonii]
MLIFLYQHQILNKKALAYWNHHPPTRLKLLNQRRRNMTRSGSDDDGIKRSMFFPTVVTIADFNLNVVIAESR